MNGIEQLNKGLQGIYKLLAARNKVLWESSTGWSTGSITVPGIENYNIIKIETINGRMILCNRNENGFLGAGGLAAWSSGAQVSAELTIVTSGNTLTKSGTYCNMMTHVYGGGHGAKMAFPAIGKITGIEPIPEKILGGGGTLKRSVCKAFLPVRGCCAC